MSSMMQVIGLDFDRRKAYRMLQMKLASLIARQCQGAAVVMAQSVDGGVSFPNWLHGSITLVRGPDDWPLAGITK